jgi:Flp pilus assembly protein TadG
MPQQVFSSMLSRLGRSERSGTAALEFALVIPVFMTLVIGIMTFALYFGAFVAVANAASDGARASVPGLSATERTSFALQAARTSFQGYAPFLSAAFLTVTAKPDPADLQRFQVTASYDFRNFDVLKISSLVAAPLAAPAMTTTVATAGYY